MLGVTLLFYESLDMSMLMLNPSVIGVIGFWPSIIRPWGSTCIGAHQKQINNLEQNIFIHANFSVQKLALWAVWSIIGKVLILVSEILQKKAHTMRSMNAKAFIKQLKNPTPTCKHPLCMSINSSTSSLNLWRFCLFGEEPTLTHCCRIFNQV